MHLFGINSEGDVHDHVGRWKDDKTLELNCEGTCENEDLEEQITAKWITKDHSELKETVYSKGKINLTTNCVFKKKRISRAKRAESALTALLPL